jgi:hypothetical protein
MSRSNDLNAGFAQIASLLIFGSVVNWMVTGNSGFFTIFIMIYFMLVATNSIKRGEGSKKK